MATRETIEKAGTILAESARAPARVILFGSHARGDAGPDSDLDFLVIERDLPNRRQERIRLRMALDGFRTPIDVVVVSERHVEKWGDVKGTMLNAALKEGRLLAETGR